MQQGNGQGLSSTAISEKLSLPTAHFAMAIISSTNWIS